MVAPANAFAFDLEQARRAAERWETRTQPREASDADAREGLLSRSEPVERKAKRINRIRDMVKRMGTAPERLPKPLRDLIRRDRPVRPDEVADISIERVLGATRDFLSVAFLEEGAELSRAIGRIVVSLGGGRVSYGTGFMVSPQLLMTNHHVLPDEASAGRATVQFDFAFDRDQRPLPIEEFRLEPKRFFLNDKDLDFALVAVAPRAKSGKDLSNYPTLPLIAEEGKIVVGECINIVQHPLGEAKQVVIRENRLMDLPLKSSGGNKADNFAYYGADTEPGSSGSPVFNDQWEVVALHHSGVPRINDNGDLLTKNGSVWHPEDDPTQLDWIANEGVRVSRLVKFFRAAKVRDHERPLLTELLKSSPVPPDPAPDPKPHPDSNQEFSPRPRSWENGSSAGTGRVAPPAAVWQDGGSMAITVPLTITMSLGQNGSGSGALRQAVSEAPAGFDESIQPDPDYDSRPGYKPDFLGIPVPLPELEEAIRRDAAVLSGTNEIELKYHHFSVIMNRTRRLAFVSAVNMDMGAPYRVNRDGGDRWFFDNRIPKQHQAGGALYSNNALDRGHLARRADAAWGYTLEEAKFANDDTFHWTNCAPQHEVFNQATKASDRGLLLWGNLEEYIARMASDEHKRVSVFNGPIFGADDRDYRGVLLPQRFYKIIAVNETGRLAAFAFLLSQGDLIDQLPRERFEPGAFQPFQVKVRTIEELTMLDFGSLRNADPLEVRGRERLFESGTNVVMITELGDIVR